MAILTRVTRKEYPGAVTEVRNPFTCIAQSTIQALALELMGAGEAKPSVIIGGKIFTEATEAELDNGICNPA